MDILNWIYLVKNKFTRTTVENPATDLLVLGADVSYAKRGDKYQNYAMPVADVVPLVYSTGTVEQLTSITTSVTLNTYSGVITTYYDAGGDFIPAQDSVSFNVTNDKVTADSIIHLTVWNPGGSTGLLSAVVGKVLNGTFEVILQNAHTVDDTNSDVSVFFSIVNVTV